MKSCKNTLNAFSIFMFMVLTFSMIFKHRYFMQHTCVYSLGEYLFFKCVLWYLAGVSIAFIAAAFC